MWVPVILITAFCGWVAVYAALVAVVLNLPYPIGVRVLLLAVGMWCYWILRALDRIKDAIVKQQYWLRLTFITAHIRNERDDLQPARDRLSEDLQEEQATKELSGGDIEPFISLGGFLIFLIVTAAVLHFGWLGEFGSGWFFHLRAYFQQR